MAKHPINPKTSAMMFFDCLQIYLHPDDPRKQAEVDASGVIPAQQRMLQACRDAGIKIFYTEIDHPADARDFKPQLVDRGTSGPPGDRPRWTVPSATITGTPGDRVIDELAPRPQDTIIRKHRWSAFYETDFLLNLQVAGIDTIILAGGNTEIGVASTAYSVRDRDFNLIVLRDACRSPDEGVNDFFMDRIFPIFGRVMTVDEAISIIAPAGAGGG